MLKDLRDSGSGARAGAGAVSEGTSILIEGTGNGSGGASDGVGLERQKAPKSQPADLVERSWRSGGRRVVSEQARCIVLRSVSAAWEGEPPWLGDDDDGGMALGLGLSSAVGGVPVSLDAISTSRERSGVMTRVSRYPARSRRSWRLSNCDPEADSGSIELERRRRFV